MRLLDAAIGALAPWTGVKARLLREQLSRHSVTVPLSAACIEELARDAHEAVARTRTPGESYLDCLQRQLEMRASFLKRWTTTDEKFDGDEWAHLVALARKYALPRPWRIPEPAATDYSPPKVEIPQHLLVTSDVPPAPSRPLAATGEPPGAAILADVQRAGMTGPEAEAAPARAEPSGSEAEPEQQQTDELIPPLLRDASRKS